MTTNETIARWLGLELKAYHPPSNRYGDYIIDGNNTHGMGYDTIFRVGDRALIGWYPDSDITLWHGEKGLLGEIEEDTDCWQQFIVALARELGLIRERVSFAVTITMDEVEADEAIWRALKATPAQLATALVEVIGEK